MFCEANFHVLFLNKNETEVKLHEIPYQNGQSVSDPFSDQNGAKTLPDRAAHTYIAYIGEYPPGRLLN